MLKEFRDFLLRGNIVELAIAFVLGVAFGALITSFVDNLLMPVVAMIIGKPDFRDLTFTINDSVFRYGAFLTDVISFVAVAAAIFFFVVKPWLKMRVRFSAGIPTPLSVIETATCPSQAAICATIFRPAPPASSHACWALRTRLTRICTTLWRSVSIVGRT